MDLNPMNLFKQGTQIQPAPGAMPDTRQVVDPNRQQNQQQQQQNQGMDQQNQNAGKGATGDTGLNPDGTPKKPGSPLDAFTETFKIDPKKPAPTDPFAEKLWNIDPKKLNEGVAKMDFTRNLNPELVQKALSGDTAAFSQILNQAIQSSFSMSVQAIIGMVEGGIGKNNERFNSVLSDKFRNFQISSSTSEHPALKHPAAKPMVDALKQLIASQNPGMVAAEVQKQAEDYFLSMGTAINSIDPKTGLPRDASGTGGGKDGAGKEPDYSLFLNL